MNFYKPMISAGIFAVACTTFANANTTFTPKGLTYEGEEGMSIPLESHVSHWTTAFKSAMETLPEGAYISAIDLGAIQADDRRAQAEITYLVEEILETQQGIERFVAAPWMTSGVVEQLVRQHKDTLRVLDLSQVVGFGDAHAPRISRETLLGYVQRLTHLKNLSFPLTEGAVTPQELETFLKATPSLVHIEGCFNLTAEEDVFKAQPRTARTAFENPHKNLATFVEMLKEKEKASDADIFRLFYGTRALEWAQRFQRDRRIKDVGNFDFSTVKNDGVFSAFAGKTIYKKAQATVGSDSLWYGSSWLSRTETVSVQDEAHAFREAVPIEHLLFALVGQDPQKGTLGRFLDAFSTVAFDIEKETGNRVLGAQNRYTLSAVGQMMASMEDLAWGYEGGRREGIAVTLRGDANHRTESTTVTFRPAPLVDGSSQEYFRGQYNPRGLWRVEANGDGSLKTTWDLSRIMQPEMNRRFPVAKNPGHLKVFLASPEATYGVISSALGASLNMHETVDLSNADLTLDQVWNLLAAQGSHVKTVYLPKELSRVTAGKKYKLLDGVTYHGQDSLLKALNVPADKRGGVPEASYEVLREELLVGMSSAFVMSPTQEVLDRVALNYVEQLIEVPSDLPRVSEMERVSEEEDAEESEVGSDEEPIDDAPVEEDDDGSSSDSDA